jgi:LPS O-antigen subunit length determinant protein (WzzB/FepE family)
MNNGASQHGESATFASVLLARAPYLLGFAFATGAAVFGLSFLLPSVFTARTIIIPPQQQQSAAGLALQNLGALAAVAGVPAGLRSSTDQYVALLKSANAGAKLIQQFNLMEVYDVKLRIDAQRELDANSRSSAGR